MKLFSFNNDISLKFYLLVSSLIRNISWKNILFVSTKLILLHGNIILRFNRINKLEKLFKTHQIIAYKMSLSWKHRDNSKISKIMAFFWTIWIFILLLFPVKSLLSWSNNLLMIKFQNKAQLKVCLKQILFKYKNFLGVFMSSVIAQIFIVKSDVFLRIYHWRKCHDSSCLPSDSQKKRKNYLNS